MGLRYYDYVANIIKWALRVNCSYLELVDVSDDLPPILYDGSASPVERVAL
jgi:hypothetical protein